jgi:hypothetical protein
MSHLCLLLTATGQLFAPLLRIETDHRSIPALPDLNHSITEDIMDNDQAAGVFAMAAGMGIFMLVIAVVFILFFGYCIKLIAEKTGRTEHVGLWWIPIAQYLPLLDIAGKPAWWIILLLVPLVNFVVLFIVMMEVAKARGKDAIWGVVAVLLPIIGFPYLAFSDGGAPATAAS